MFLLTCLRFLGNIKNLSASNIFPLVANSITSKSSLLEYNDIKNTKCSFETKYDNGCSSILAKICIVLIALLIKIIFPAIPDKIAVLLALLLFIAIMMVFFQATNKNAKSLNI